MEPGFLKGDSRNLPNVDVQMLCDFMATTTNFSGIKAVRSGRESYGDSAVGYVQVKRHNDTCIVRGRVCPEHKVRVKPYSVICVIDEKENKIEEIRCLDCVASAGGCKHSIAFLMWLHRRSEEPAPTSVLCYWNKPVLSKVGSNIKFVKAVDIGRKVKTPVLNITKCDNFVHEVFEMVKNQKYVCPLSVHTSLINGAKTLSLHILFTDFLASDLQHTADNFIVFCCDVLTEENIANACSLSHSQSEESLWHELRFARITASKLYDAAVCKSSSGALVNQIMGVTKLFQTAAMKRGITLEKSVIHELEKQINCPIRPSGFTILKKFGVIGASPDGITDDSVIEIKCPLLEKSVSKYITKEGKIAKKFLAQINLQMLAVNVKKGIFCVASPDFEQTKKITVVNVEYDAEFMEHVIDCALNFWKANIFPLLYKSYT